jgi:hypothetical protein
MQASTVGRGSDPNLGDVAPPRIGIAGFGTHLPALMGCVAATSGPVLELGSGYYSTPILHAVTPGRRLVTADNYAAWLARFRYLQSPDHELHIVHDWDAFDLIDEPWDVAFVDMAPDEARAAAIRRLRERTRYIVVHDTEAESYGFEPLFSEFKYRHDFRNQLPYATVVSDHADLPFELPSLLANHTAREIETMPARLETEGSDRWRTVEVATDARIPDHFFLELHTDVRRLKGDAEVQLVFRTDSPDDFFWWQLGAGKLSQGKQRFTIASDDIPQAGHPSWKSVDRVELRAKGVDGGGAEIEIERLGLMHLDLEGVAPATVAVEGPTAWRTFELATGLRVPDDFSLELSTNTRRLEGDTNIQLVFRTPDPESYFWWRVGGGNLSTGEQTFTVTPNVTKKVGDASWDAVDRLELRAIAAEGGAATFEVRSLRLNDGKPSETRPLVASTE